MKIQELLFPSVEICERGNMYYRLAQGATMYMSQQTVRFKKSGMLDTNTYFNGFSIGKWRKYTVLDNLSVCLRIKGSFIIEIRHIYRVNNSNVERMVSEDLVNSEGGDTHVNIPITDNVGMYFFRLRAEKSGSEFYGGYYETSVAVELPPVKIAIGICTYRREEYVAHNVQLFRERLIENPESPLYHNLEVFLSDNGKTLPVSMNFEHIHVFPNKNVGGSGGFTRCMIEVMKVREEQGITHILMMDDDVHIEPHAFALTHNFLRLLRKEYRDAFIGGAMLRLDRRNIQHEVGAYRSDWMHYAAKQNYDLEDLSLVLENEIEDTVNYYAWWYCCMPVSVIREDNLPLPLFIKQDDIEFGVRNGRTFINMNGICLWHEPFEYKCSEYLEYFNYRNMCIVSAIHRPGFTKKVLKRHLTVYIWRAISRYQYLEAELTMLGMQDFLKGIDWLKEQDGEKLNQAVRKVTYHKVPAGQAGIPFRHADLEKSFRYHERKQKRYYRLLSLNGWLLPARKKTVIVPAMGPAQGLFYRAKRVLYYEDSTGKAYISEKSYRKLFYILKMYRRTLHLISRDFDRVAAEYRDRCGEITNLTFWNEYLSRDGVEIVMKSGLPE